MAGRCYASRSRVTIASASCLILLRSRRPVLSPVEGCSRRRGGEALVQGRKPVRSWVEGRARSRGLLLDPPPFTEMLTEEGTRGLHPDPPPWPEVATEEGTLCCGFTAKSDPVPSPVNISVNLGGLGWGPLHRRADGVQLPPERTGAPRRLRVELFVFLCLLTLAACGGNGGAPPTGPAQISTIAYVVTQCREGPEGFSGSQALWVRRGERPALKLVEVALGEPPFSGICGLFASSRSGSSASAVGSLQRLAVSPDGSLVLFELTDDFSPLTPVLSDEQEGIFVVRSDGTGLRRITRQSGDVWFRVDWACVLGGGFPCTGSNADPEFDPDGRWVTYTDLGPSQIGEEAPQVVAVDVTTGEREQVTHLPPLPICEAQPQPSEDCVRRAVPPVAWPSFLDDRTIAYVRGKGDSAIGGGLFTVQRRADGSWGEPEEAPEVGLEGGIVIPVYQITGAEPSATTNLVPGVPENGPGAYGNVVTEAFVIEATRAPGDDPRVLQLTNFGRSETGGTRMSLDRLHVIFRASEPLEGNPFGQCQWFSIDRLGRDLHPLTFFGSGDAAGCNCGGVCPAAPRCTITFDGNVDRITGSLEFGTNCDPFGTNPNGGDQFFAMRADGSGLRQLTQTRGIVRGADGTIEVEMPGPFAAPWRLR